LNIGSATAGVLYRAGATVHMVSSSKNKLEDITREFGKIRGGKLEFSALDLMDEKEVREFVQSLPKDKSIYWVQSVGLGAGSYKLKDDNPYLSLEEIPIELIKKETEAVLVPTHLMMKEFLPIFRKQKETRVALISSMSAVRGYSLGGTHCAAKAAISRYANASMIGLYKNNIFVTDIRPGAIDTGMYDFETVQTAAKSVSKEYDGNWLNCLTLAPPTSVGQAIKFVFTTPAHIPSINLVAKGQFPHEGS